MERLVALVVTVLLHLVVATFLLGRWQVSLPGIGGDTARERAPAAATAAIAGHEAHDSSDGTWLPQQVVPDAPRSFASRSRDDALERAAAAGRAHEQRRRATQLRWRDRYFGEPIAGLLRMPIEQAWPALEQLVSEGDSRAAEALLELAAGCGHNEFARDAAYRHTADEATRGLEPRVATFIRSALDEERAWQREAFAQCNAHGLGGARLATFLGRPAPSSETSGSVFAEFMQEFVPEGATYPIVSPHGAALRRLMDGREPLTRDEWVTLLAALESDPWIALAIGHCLRSSCDDMPPMDRALRRQLQIDAAAFGSFSALTSLAEGYGQDGDHASRYAWWLYGRWAASTGCIPIATMTDLSGIALRLRELDGTLAVAERAAGAARARTLIATHGARMRALWNCPR